MTAQRSHRFFNESRTEIRGRFLYAVVRGDISTRNGWGDAYDFENPPEPPSGFQSTSLWRGYIASFTLRETGQLELTSYWYPKSGGRWRTVRVSELLHGDFWMVMKHSFFAPRTCVPFEDGVIVSDRTCWVVEEKRIPKLPG